MTIFNSLTYYLISFSGESIESKSILNNNIKICSEIETNQTNFELEIITQKPYLTTYQHVDIYPNLNNMLCLGKIIEISLDQKEEIYLVYGINDNLYNLMNIFFNSIGFLSFIYLLNRKRLRSYIALLVFVLFLNNVLINSLFAENNDLIVSILSYSFWINILSFYLLTIPFLKKNSFYLVTPIIYYILFDYDFFGIYSVLILINYLNNQKLSSINHKEGFLYFLPVLFFSSRIITATSEKLNLFWEFQFQKFYFGYTRFFDLQYEFLVLRCHVDKGASHILRFVDNKTIFCLDWHGYGPIRKIIPLYGEVWSSVLIAYIIIFLIFILQYSHLVKRYKHLIFIITLLFLSPPVNLLIHLGNPDIFYFVCVYFIILLYKKFPVFASFLIYVFTLWKIHAVGILFGLLIFSIFGREIKKSILNFFFICLTGATYLIDALFVEPLIIPEAPDERMGYGILHDAKHLTKYTKFENFNHIIFFYLLLSLICIVTIYKILKNYNFEDYNFGYEVYAFMFWFFLTVIYENQSYRLPLFIPLFIFLFNLKIKELNYSIILAIFLNPVIAIDNLFIEKTTLIFNRLGIYFIFCFLISKLFYDLSKYYKSIKLSTVN